MRKTWFFLKKSIFFIAYFFKFTFFEPFNDFYVFLNSFIAGFILAFCGSSTSTQLQCRFSDSFNYDVVGTIYECDVNNNPRITTEESAEISRISGTHKSSKSNNDVIGFRAYGITIQFFPKGLNKFFKNLKMINIQSCQLKEIHQSDLKVFPKLVYLKLQSNDIEVIEEGLFDFNSNLEYIEFFESKIIHIDPNVFDHLNNLRYFHFFFVRCVGLRISNSKLQVQNALRVVKSKCTNSEFLSLDNQIRNLKIESKTLNSKTFNTKLESVKKILKSSKFSKFRPLNYKLKNLENERCSNCHQIARIEFLETKVENLEVLVNDEQNKLLEKLQQNEKEMTKKLQKMSTNIDEKIDGIQKDLIKKFEEILEEKLGKIFNEKLGNLTDAKMNTTIDSLNV